MRLRYFNALVVAYIQELVKLVTRLQEQVVRSLQTGFRESQISEFVKSSNLVVCRRSLLGGGALVCSLTDKSLHIYYISSTPSRAARIKFLVDAVYSTYCM